MQYHIELSHNIKPEETDTANQSILYDPIYIKF